MGSTEAVLTSARYIKIVSDPKVDMPDRQRTTKLYSYSYLKSGFDNLKILKNNEISIDIKF